MQQKSQTSLACIHCVIVIGTSKQHALQVVMDCMKDLTGCITNARMQSNERTVVVGTIKISALIQTFCAIVENHALLLLHYLTSIKVTCIVLFMQ